MKRSTRVLLLVGAIAGNAPSAYAGLAAIDPAPNSPCGASNGFPKWVKDTNGVTLDLPRPPVGNGVAAPTMIFGPLTGVSNVIAQTAGFDTEAFYFFARTGAGFAIATPGGKTATTPITATFGIEASYVNGVPTAGQQMIFSRMRIKFPVSKLPGRFKITHPWGVENITADATNAKTGFFTFTKDVGLTAGWTFTSCPANFALVPAGATNAGFFGVMSAANTLSTFLTQQSNITALAGQWIGDGVTEGLVLGGTNPGVYTKPAPGGTFAVKIESLDLDKWYPTPAEYDTFVVSGHISVPPVTAFEVSRATRSNRAGQEYVDLFLSALPTTQISVTAGTTTSTPAAVPVNGQFFTTVPVAPLTRSVTVNGTFPTFAPTSRAVAVSDVVNIVEANYNTTTNLVVSIKAITSNAPDVTGLVAKLSDGTQINLTTKDTTTYPGFALFSSAPNLPLSTTGVVPQSVTVISTHQDPAIVGGQDTAPISIVGP